MNILNPGYEILTPIVGDELELIEKAGRTCYRSEDKITGDGASARKFVRMLIENDHLAMIEHSSLTVRFTVDRGVTHELVRHRIASFAQESTRYCNYSKGKFGNEISVISPANGIKLDAKMRELDAETKGEILAEWICAMEDAEKHYMKLIELGATPQMARSVLPTSTKSTITITANYREWRNILKLRTAKDAHPQIREVCIPLLIELQKKIPVIFDDIPVPDDIWPGELT